MIISVCVKNGEQGLTSASLGSLLAAAPGLLSLRFTWGKSNG